jgi:hypothetical protein
MNKRIPLSFFILLLMGEKVQVEGVFLLSS